MAGIVPEPGRQAEVARTLLDLAGPGRAHLVATRTYPWYGFEVPDDIAEAYTALQAGAAAPVAEVPPEPVQDPGPDPEPSRQPAAPEPDKINDIPVSPRRTRARKAAAS